MRHRPEQTTLYRLVQQHAAHFIAHTAASTGAELRWFIKEEFNAFLECGILVLDGVYCCGADGMPGFIQVSAPTDEELRALLQAVIVRLMKMLTRLGVLVEAMGQTRLAEPDADSEEVHTLRPLQAARPVAGPFVRHKQSTRLYVSGLSAVGQTCG